MRYPGKGYRRHPTPTTAPVPRTTSGPCWGTTTSGSGQGMNDTPVEATANPAPIVLDLNPPGTPAQARALID